jgi:hypothetical protein
MDTPGHGAPEFARKLIIEAAMSCSFSVRLFGRQIAVITLLLALAQHAASAGRSGDARQDLLDAWEKRQTAVHSFDFTIADDVYGAAHTVEALQSDDSRVRGTKKAPEVTFSGRQRLAMADDWHFREERDELVWSSRQNKHIAQTAVLVYDGKVRKTFFPESGLGHRVAFIMNGEDPGLNAVRGLFITGDLHPLLLIYRPLHANMRYFDRTNCKIEGTEGVEGANCVIVEQDDPHISHCELRVWADPSKDFLPVRFQESRAGRVQRSVDFHYEKTDKNGWVPSGWTSGQWNGAQLTSSHTVKVVRYELNTALPDSTFDIGALPPDTYVRNLLTKEDYILREDGSRREVLDGEYNGDNYQTLLNTDTPGRSAKAIRWLVISGATVLCALLIVGYVRHRRARAA